MVEVVAVEVEDSRQRRTVVAGCHLRTGVDHQLLAPPILSAAAPRVR